MTTRVTKKLLRKLKGSLIKFDNGKFIKRFRVFFCFYCHTNNNHALALYKCV